MWGTVIILGLLATLDPVRIGIATLLFSRPRPMLNLLVFWIGGVVISFAVGFGVLFVVADAAGGLLEHARAAAGSAAGGRVQVAMGAAALLLALVIATRLSVRARLPQVASPGPVGRWSQQLQHGLAHGPVWFAFVVGVGMNTPAEYVAALAVILASGATAGAQAGALAAFTVLALAFAEIPLLCRLAAPRRTQAVMDAVHTRVLRFRRHVIAAVVAVVGVLLLAGGFGVG